MIEQINGNYTFIPEEVQKIVDNKISLLDSFIIFQTDSNIYSSLIKNNASDVVKRIDISLNNDGIYSIIEYEVEDMQYSLSNEMYVVSNVGKGSSMHLTCYDGVISYGICAICCFLMFGIVFKGVLFKCLKRRRR